MNENGFGLKMEEGRGNDVMAKPGFDRFGLPGAVKVKRYPLCLHTCLTKRRNRPVQQF